jgi:short-subunit dehydrogenase
MIKPSSVPQRATHTLALVSGATGGLGKAFAVECASRGWDLFLTDLSAERLQVLSEGLQPTYGVRVLTQACDLTDPQARAALLAGLRVQRLRFAWLINVAGVDYEGLFYEQTAQHIQNIVRLNVEATLGLTRGMLELRDPLAPFHILNVASLAAFSPMPVKATYAASKRFLLDFSLALREELRDLGISVTALCPAGMPTTPECIAGIQAQGWMGQLTTYDVGAVANAALESALAGRAVCIPGAANRALSALSRLAPASWAAVLVGKRWKAAHQRRGQPAMAPNP